MESKPVVMEIEQIIKKNRIYGRIFIISDFCTNAFADSLIKPVNGEVVCFKGE